MGSDDSDSDNTVSLAAGQRPAASVLHLTNIFTVVLRDCVCLFVELSPPKPLDQSKNVTVRTFHTWPGSVHEHNFWPKFAKKSQYKYSLEAIE